MGATWQQQWHLSGATSRGLGGSCLKFHGSAAFPMVPGETLHALMFVKTLVCQTRQAGRQGGGRTFAQSRDELGERRVRTLVAGAFGRPACVVLPFRFDFSDAVVCSNSGWYWRSTSCRFLFSLARASLSAFSLKPPTGFTRMCTIVLFIPLERLPWLKAAKLSTLFNPSS